MGAIKETTSIARACDRRDFARAAALLSSARVQAVAASAVDEAHAARDRREAARSVVPATAGSDGAATCCAVERAAGTNAARASAAGKNAASTNTASTSAAAIRAVGGVGRAARQRSVSRPLPPPARADRDPLARRLGCEARLLRDPLAARDHRAGRDLHRRHPDADQLALPALQPLPVSPPLPEPLPAV